MKQDILIFAEQRDGIVQKISYELAGGAKRLAAKTQGRVIALLAGSFKKRELSYQASMLGKSGADLVYFINSPELSEYMPAPYIDVLIRAAKEINPSIFLIGSTSIGVDLAPEVSLGLDTGLVSDCTGLSIDETNRRLLMERPGSDGLSMEIFYCLCNRPAMATVRPGVLSPQTSNQLRKTQLRKLTFDISSCQDAELLEVQPGRIRTADITQAKVLVAGGRGIGGPEGFISLQKIADLLCGEIACSRACVEAGWIDASSQVGQTGKTVRPELYLSFGISGAFQHVTGMENSKLIISVNKNSAAKIFDISDLAIVANAENIIPALIKALEEIKISP